MSHVEYARSSFCNGIANVRCPECGYECLVFEAQHHGLGGPAKCQTGKRHSFVGCQKCGWKDTPDSELCQGNWAAKSGYKG